MHQAKELMYYGGLIQSSLFIHKITSAQYDIEINKT